jgi:hypothetical protein
MGPDVSVGGAAYGSPGPITVTGPTTAVAQIQIKSSASIGTHPALVTTGIEQPRNQQPLTSIHLDWPLR